jgi:hypothetical protein
MGKLQAKTLQNLLTWQIMVMFHYTSDLIYHMKISPMRKGLKIKNT